MKRFLFGFLAVLFLILNTIPYLHILADDMPTNSQYEMLGAYALSTLITSGEATELDFSDYTENDTSFLIDLGEAIFTGDWSGLAEDGLEWLGETADSIYDSYKEYVSQWKSDHLGIMYSDWFPDETIYVGPDDSYSLAKPLRQLLTPRDGIVVPEPSPDFSFISNINNVYYRYNEPNIYDLSIYQFRNYNYDSYNQISNSGSSNLRNFTLIGDNFSSNHVNNTNMISTIKCSVYDGVTSIYVTTDNGINVTYSTSSLYNSYPFYRNSYDLTNLRSSGVYYLAFIYNSNSDNIILYNQSSFNGLSTCINYIYQHYANVNLYVDGVPWALVTEPTYPIVIPGQLTIYNDEPLEYSFPADTHIDLPDLTNIIRNAINSSGVVMWSDIADTYVDVNGQTAVAVTKIVRNDYDNLYMEQYPYPAMLVGMTDQTKFNEHLLDNSHAYLSPISTVVQDTVNVLPSELVGVLAIGAILTIFAVIINRLLE